MDNKKNIKDSFIEIKKQFPFKDLIDNFLPKYQKIGSIIFNKSNGSKILSIGSGPCSFEAILSREGYEVTAIDDLNDQWHLLGDNRKRIIQFADDMNVNLLVGKAGSENLEESIFDVVILLDVIEHLHESPRDLINASISYLKPGGLLIIETPNSARLAERIKLLFGKNSNVNFNYFYWNIGKYRGHIREYTRFELKKLLSIHGIKNVNIEMLNYSIDLVKDTNFFKGLIVNLYKIICLYPNFRDTIIIYGEKPNKWVPINNSVENFKKNNKLLGKYDFENESDEVIIKKIKGDY